MRLIHHHYQPHATLLALCLCLAGPAMAQSTATSTTPALASMPATVTTAARDGAEVVLTTADLVRTVVQNNPLLQASLRSRESAAAAITSAGAAPNPRVEMSGGNNRPRIPSATGGAVGGWAVSQLIENPSLREARISGARHAERGSQQQIAVTTNELIAQVRLRAFEYLLRQEEAKAAADALALLEQIRTRVRVRVESGEAARYEVIKANAEIINAQQKLQSAQLQIEQAALAINRLAAGKLPARWTLSARLGDAPDAPGLEAMRQSALLHNPELKTLQASLDRQEARVAEARASRWPGVELRYNQMRDPELRQGMLSVNVQIPLIDQRAGPLAEASAEAARARVQLEGRREDLSQQVLMAWKAIEIARGRVTALSTGAIPEAEAVLRVAEAAYRFGERGILDVLDAQRLLRSVSADLLDARYQLQAANVEIDYLAGRFADINGNSAAHFFP